MDLDHAKSEQLDAIFAAYDADLAALEREEPFEEFRMNAKLVVMAQRPIA